MDATLALYATFVLLVAADLYRGASERNDREGMATMLGIAIAAVLLLFGVVVWGMAPN